MLTFLLINLGSRYSQLGKPWESVIKLYCEETKDIFQCLTDLQNRAEQISRIPVCLGQSSESERVALRRTQSVDRTAGYE